MTFFGAVPAMMARRATVYGGCLAAVSGSQNSPWAASAANGWARDRPLTLAKPSSLQRPRTLIQPQCRLCSCSYFYALLTSYPGLRWVMTCLSISCRGLLFSTRRLSIISFVY